MQLDPRGCIKWLLNKEKKGYPPRPKYRNRGSSILWVLIGTYTY